MEYLLTNYTAKSFRHTCRWLQRLIFYILDTVSVSITLNGKIPLWTKNEDFRRVTTLKNKNSFSLIETVTRTLAVMEKWKKTEWPASTGEITASFTPQMEGEDGDRVKRAGGSKDQMKEWRMDIQFGGWLIVETDWITSWVHPTADVTNVHSLKIFAMAGDYIRPSIKALILHPTPNMLRQLGMFPPSAFSSPLASPVDVSVSPLFYYSVCSFNMVTAK